MTARRPERPDRDRAGPVPEPDARAAAGQEQLREIVARWFPLADWQRERLALLLHPGTRRDAG
jgi:hypothetical protein